MLLTEVHLDILEDALRVAALAAHDVWLLVGREAVGAMTGVLAATLDKFLLAKTITISALAACFSYMDW